MSDKRLDEKTQEFGGKGLGEGEQVREEEEFGEVGKEEKLGEGDEFGENEESYSVENDRETMSVSSSNELIKNMSIDRLSALPDSLLIHILSFLGMEKAAITGVLSRRWQFLWTYLPRMEFRERSIHIEKVLEFVGRVHRILVIRCGNYLEKFSVTFVYDECFASDVDAWVEFAVKNKVKEVSLLLHSYEGDFYTLPQMMYSNSSLRELLVRGCIMAPQRTIEWQSLTSLCILHVELPQQVIEKIISGCPVLYRLDIGACWGFNCLEVNSQSLKILAVSDHEVEVRDPLLEISAPYLHSLDVSLFPEGRQLLLTNIPSLVRADIGFTGYDWDPSSVEVMSNTWELFENIQHVKELELGRLCFEAVSMLVVNGWQLPQSRRGHLVVNAVSEFEHTISGIMGLLESSPNLETLVLEGYETYGESVALDPTAKDDLDCDLLHLKTVNITNFADLNGEPMLTLARILLKRATVLEKMVIVTDVEDTSGFVKIGQTLLNYPRSSQKVVVLLP